MALTCLSLTPKINPSTTNTLTFSFITPKLSHYRFDLKTRFKLYCSNNEQHKQFLEGFSLLESEPPWESSDVWSTMALYFFSLHVPLSFGGLSLIAHLFRQPIIDPQLKAVSILGLGTMELFASVLLLELTAKPEYKPVRFLECNTNVSTRNWVFAALVGFAVLVGTIYLTSELADKFVQNEGVNNQNMKEILSSGGITQISIGLIYCVVAALVEDIVYRRFFLTSLSSTMKYHEALVVSSVIFAGAHLSGENFIQLWLIGMILGCSYSWSGDLRSSLLLHSMYNALTLFIDFYA